MLGLLSLRIFEATGAEITDLGEEHATGRCACAAKAPRSSWSRYRPVLRDERATETTPGHALQWVLNLAADLYEERLAACRSGLYPRIVRCRKFLMAYFGGA
jgi:hypothetical protein